MKLYSLFTLFAVAAASDGAQQGDAQQEAYGSAAQQDSYGSATEAYGSTESYGHQDYEPVAYKPKICVGVCPDQAPFFDLDSGSCHPGICEPPPYESHSYEPPTQAYGDEHQEQQSGYRSLQAGYGAPEASYGEPDCNLVAPHGNFVDTRFNRVSRTGRIALWIGFILLFLPAVYYINRYLCYHYVADVADGTADFRIGSARGKDIYSFLAHPALICGVVCFFASLAYLAMATSNGFYVRCCDGREFYYARYLDWIITTPLMLHGLVYLGNFNDDIWHYLFFQDVLMIASGLIGSTVCNSDRWIFFAFSMLNFLPIIYYLCDRKNHIVDNNIYDATGNIVTRLARGDITGAVAPHIWFLCGFDNVVRLTVLAWSLYPIVWILSEGTGTISSNGEAIFYTVLDVIAKTGFGLVVVTMKRSSIKNARSRGYKFNNDYDDELEKDFNDNKITAVVTGSSSHL